MKFATLAVLAFAAAGGVTLLVSGAGSGIVGAVAGLNPLQGSLAGEHCHPSYRGICLPVDVADVDCTGQDGNGPVFATGPFQVVGQDVFGLDPDRDGIGCEYTGRPLLAGATVSVSGFDSLAAK